MATMSKYLVEWNEDGDLDIAHLEGDTPNLILTIVFHTHRLNPRLEKLEFLHEAITVALNTPELTGETK